MSKARACEGLDYILEWNVNGLQEDKVRDLLTLSTIQGVSSQFHHFGLNQTKVMKMGALTPELKSEIR